MRKVEVGFVKYHYVKVEVPEDYPQDIDEWDIDQIEFIQQKAKKEVSCCWEIDDDFEMELIDE